MLPSNSALASVKNNLSLLQVRSRYKRHDSGKTSPLESLSPKLKLSSRGKQRVRDQQSKNLFRDAILLASVIATTICLMNVLLF